MTRIVRQTICVACAGMLILALTALPARAIDINNLPDWVRDSIHPVEIDWSQVYPGLAPPPAWAQEPSAVQEVHPGAGTAQTAGIDTLSTVSPAGPAGALNVAHPATAATGGLQTVSPSPIGGLQTASPASGLGGIGGLAPVHPSAAATAGLHEVNPTPAAMTGLHEVKPASSATAGLEPVSAGPIVGQINRLTPTDTRAQQLLLTWSAQLRDGTLDRDGVKQLITEQNVPSETLIGVLNGLPLAHPMDPVYLPVCETLWQRSGEKLDTCLALPYAPRIYMATYLGTIAREEEAKTLLSSLENPDKMGLGADLYHVANEVADYQRKSPSLAIWAWKWGATMRGPEDQVRVCYHIAWACKEFGRADLAGGELVPWAEEALARHGGELFFARGLEMLLWAYNATGAHAKGAERGQYWIEEAERRGVAPATMRTVRKTVAIALVRTGSFEVAATTLGSAYGDDAATVQETLARFQASLHVAGAAGSGACPPQGLVEQTAGSLSAEYAACRQGERARLGVEVGCALLSWYLDQLPTTAAAVEYCHHFAATHQPAGGPLVDVVVGYLMDHQGSDSLNDDELLYFTVSLPKGEETIPLLVGRMEKDAKSRGDLRLWSALLVACLAQERYVELTAHLKRVMALSGQDEGRAELALMCIRNLANRQPEVARKLVEALTAELPQTHAACEARLLNTKVPR